MKISRILFSVAVAIVLIALGLFNMGMKAQYTTMMKTGINKYIKINRFKQYEKVNITKFEALELKSANIATYHLEYGDEPAVWIQKSVRENYVVTQAGSKLVIDLTDKAREEQYEDTRNRVVIISPEISMVSSFPFIPETPPKNKREFDYYKKYGVSISGFEQGTLKLNISDVTRIEMQHNNLSRVTATVGSEHGSGIFSMDSDNNVDTVQLNVIGQSTAEILDTYVKHFDNQISDSSIVTFRGTNLQKINKIVN